MLGSNGPGYHSSFSQAAFVIMLLIALMAGFALLSTTPTGDSGADFPGYHRTLHPVYGGMGGATRDALMKAL